MQLSKRRRYALSALLDLAQCQEKKEVTSAREIAKRQRIPLSFLEQLLLSMKRCQLVDSIRGPKGGYRLARKASEINVFQVFSSVGEQMELIECLQAKQSCYLQKNCLTRPLWEKLNSAFFQILSETSLEDLCRQKRFI
jgi:Rrf2 family transcriptional regulator, iron-sulfur cluster assembly transcription factor